jgi:hypothetical protein
MSVPALSQEKQDYPHDDNFKVHDEMTQPVDAHINLNKEPLRDSVVVKPIAASRLKPDGSSNKNKTEEETLSFNFLYFIIQKFKVSDIINN